MMTAVSARAGSFRSRLRSVVFPAPRKPVSTVSGIGVGGAWSLGGRRGFAHCVVALTFGFAVFAGLALLVALVPWSPGRPCRRFGARRSFRRPSFLLRCGAGGLLDRVGTVSRAGENDNGRGGFDRRPEHKFGGLCIGKHEGLAIVRFIAGAGCRSALPALPRFPPMAACDDGRRTFLREDWAAAHRSGPTHPRCRAKA